MHAWEWARKKYGEQGVVLKAEVRLSDCLDLLDLNGTRELKRVFAAFSERLKGLGVPLPANKGKNHGLDRAVINFFAEESQPAVRVIRAAFIEGERLWEGSDLWEEAHVQLAVRDIALLRNLARVEDPENELS